MAEQTFRSPGFFEREIDASQRTTEIVGIPAGVVGTAEKGPAFVPVTVGSTSDFIDKFGDLDPDRFGPYAVEAFLANRTALTYVRVLGAGANSTAVDVSNTQTFGTVKNAGFAISGSRSNSVTDDVAAGSHADGITGIGVKSGFHFGARADGAVQFIAARHHVSASTDYSYPVFQDNPSYTRLGDSGKVNLVRGVVFMATGSRLQTFSMDTKYANTRREEALPTTAGLFKIAISSSAGSAFTSEFKDEVGADLLSLAGVDALGPSDGTGVRIRTASLDPTSPSYIAKILNTDPRRFAEEKHLLYLDFAVENELAPVDNNYLDNGAGGIATGASVAILSGSQKEVSGSGTFSTHEAKALQLFGRFDTRYRTPRSPDVLSQPYGGKEYPLFHFEALSDGAYANDKVKVTIANLKASTNENYKFPSFEVQVRRF